MTQVMVVDDSSAVRASVSLILRNAGHEAFESHTAEHALTQLSEGRVKPKLFILDLNMPGMNGIDLIRRIRTLPGFRFVPILMLTTESQQSKRTEAKSAGATGWLVKPIGPEDLLRVVKQVCPGS